MPVTLYQVDAFTDTPFRGNPAGVCLLPAPRSEVMRSRPLFFVAPRRRSTSPPAASVR